MNAKKAKWLPEKALKRAEKKKKKQREAKGKGEKGG